MPAANGRDEDLRRGWLARLEVGDDVIVLQHGLEHREDGLFVGKIHKITAAGGFVVKSYRKSISFDHIGVGHRGKWKFEIQRPTREVVEEIEGYAERGKVREQLLTIFSNSEFLRKAPLLVLKTVLTLLRPAYTRWEEEYVEIEP